METREHPLLPPGARWASDLRPLPPKTEADVIREFVAGQRVGLPRRFECRRADVKHLTPNAAVASSDEEAIA